jgi:hypothetical protein
MRHVRLCGRGPLLLGSLLVAACAVDPAIETTAGGQDGSAATGNTGGSSGSGGLVPTPPGATGGRSGMNGNGASPSGGPTCSSTSAKATPLPVDILILQDRSGSMKEPAMAGGSLSKWDATKQAITAFLQSPDTVGLEVGLNFFPAGNGGRDESGSCSASQYTKPSVGIDVLPGVGTAIASALVGTTPMGGTPTLPALLGAVQYAHGWEMTKNRRVAIALATDGEPNDCNSSIQAVSQAAAAAASMGIYTFVIGVGPNLQNLDAIAKAGGTKMPYFADTASVDQLIAAFKGVQMQAAKLACSFAIPAPPMGGTLDPSRVNVSFTPANGASIALGQVGSRRQCGPMGGWYFDDPSAPRSVSLCDASCRLVNSSPDGELSLLFGCMTNVIR